MPDALALLIAVVALATVGAWAWELKHERLRKDMDDGTQAQLPDSHPDAGRNTQPVADASSAAD